MIYFILFIYIAFTFWGSLKNDGIKENTPESYFLANRNLKTITLFFTILATNFSAFYFIGFAGEGYRVGYAHYIIMAFGTGFAALSVYLIGSVSWETGKKEGIITPAELIEFKSKSKPLKYLFASVMLIYTLPYLALQIIGGGYILEELTGGQLSYDLSIVLLTFFTIAYVLIGGMNSVAKTDVKQGILMIGLMAAAVIVICIDLGGVGNAHESVYNIKPDLFSPEGDNNKYTPQQWFSFIIFWFFCIPMFPQLFMRFFIARDLSHFKKTVFFYASIPLIISIFPVTIGVLGHLTFPDLIGKQADQILPMMLTHHSSEWFYALVMVGAIAAFMSTLDSQLLAIGTIVSRDFLLPLSGGKLSLNKQVSYGKIAIVIFAFIGLLVAFRPFDTIFEIGKLAFAGYAILFPVTFIYLKLNGMSARLGIFCILISQILLWGFKKEIISDKICYGFEPIIMILFMQFIIIFVAKYFSKSISIQTK